MKRLFLCISVLLCGICLYAQQSQAAIDAPNIDFSNGDFTNWTREILYFKHIPKIDPNDPNEKDRYAFRYVPMAESDKRIDIMGTNMTDDPIISCHGLLKINPDAGKVVARIGVPQGTEAYIDGSYCEDRPEEAQGERLSYTYQITEATSILYLRYAAVLFLPPNGDDHLGEERPSFKIDVEIVDRNTGTTYTPPCKTFQTISEETSDILESFPSNATCGSSLAKENYHNYQYRPWSTSVVDLREHVGRWVTLSVEVHDCLVRCGGDLIVPGGHEAYGYFRAEATSYKLNAMVCNGNDLELTAPTGYARYEWRSSIGDAPVTRDANEPNKAYLDPTRMQIGATYYCDMYDDMHCAKITLSAQVDPVQLTPNISYQNFCNGKVEFEDFSTATGDNIVGWLWDFGDGQKSSEQNPVHVYDKPGNYTVTLTLNSEKGCSESLESAITVRYFPNLKIQTEPSVCEGQDIHLSVLNVVEEGSYIEWKDGTGNIIATDVSSLVLPTTNGTTSGSYSVYVKDINGCEYTDDKQVSVFNATYIYIDGPTHACPNTEVTLDIKGSNVGNIKWNAFDKSDASVTFFPTETTVYKVEGTDNNGCKANAEFTLNVYEQPVLSVDAPAVCKGNDATIIVTGADSYTWSLPSLSRYSGGEVTLTAVEEDVDFEVTGHSIDGCTTKVPVTLKVKDIPTVSIEGYTTRCFNSEPFELLAHGADTYLWNGTEEGSTFTATSDRNHRVTLVGSIENCSSEPLLIELNTYQPPTVSPLQESVTICEGDIATLQVTGADQYQWYDYPEITNTLAVSPTESKIYTVQGVSEDGCLSNKVEIPVTVHHANQVSLIIKEEIACPYKPDSVVIVAEGALAYKWSSEPALEGIEFNNSDRLDAVYDSPVTITVEGTNEFACSSKTQIMLNRLPVPEFEFKLEPTWIEAGHSNVHLTGIQPTSNMKWFWDMGDGSEIIQSRDSIHSYDINNFTLPFTVKVTAIDEYGCRYEGESEINIWKPIWAPNAFTPNGDGMNDVFRFYGTHILSTLDFYIYNRLGEVVYEGKTPDDSWDGTFNGAPCPWGVYGWVAHYTANVNDELREETLKGQVSIVK